MQRFALFGFPLRSTHLSHHPTIPPIRVLFWVANPAGKLHGGIGHPDFPLSPGKATAKLESTTIAGVTLACRLQAVEIMKQQGVLEELGAMHE